MVQNSSQSSLLSVRDDVLEGHGDGVFVLGVVDMEVMWCSCNFLFGCVCVLFVVCSVEQVFW